MLIVSLGFIGAGCLIGSSYKKWQESPIATSTTTHRVEELDLPVVTVCPPKGSYTALNYDLLKAENQSLSEKDRKVLQKNLHDDILRASHENYVRTVVGIVNPENIEKVYEGFQSVPQSSRLPRR